jgi:hypothetical protein
MKRRNVFDHPKGINSLQSRVQETFGARGASSSETHCTRLASSADVLLKPRAQLAAIP